MKTPRITGIVAAAFFITLVMVPDGWAQDNAEPSPLANFVLSGYGSAGFGAVTADDFKNDFSASISPVMLYSMGSDLLFEAELEFGLSGPSTTTTLEYAQANYLGFDRVLVTAGKFLMPFGLFTERYHPSWINKMPTAPLLYGHAHGGVAEGALMPILSDAGVLARLKQPLGSVWSLDVSGWVTQGPRIIAAAAEGDAHDDGPADDGHAHKSGIGPDDHGDNLTAADLDIPGVGFGVSFDDNNENKLLGGRVGLVNGPVLEAYVSGFYAKYDDDERLYVYGLNYAMDVKRAGYELRGEVTVLTQEFKTDTGFDDFARWGYYVQVSRRINALEPVLRWSELVESTVHDVVAFPDRQEIAFGLNYWISPSVPVKVMYAVDLDGDDNIMVQWAFGF